VLNECDENSFRFKRGHFGKIIVRCLNCPSYPARNRVSLIEPQVQRTKGFDSLPTSMVQKRLSRGLSVLLFERHDVENKSKRAGTTEEKSGSGLW
jgi:hypothetical protein